MKLLPYTTITKRLGETPLEAMEAWRKRAGAEYASTPLAYAGRLDPMATGKLLILIGDTCKVQTRYHNLDKRYEFSVLLGVGSDTGDVLGRLSGNYRENLHPSKKAVATILPRFRGTVSLPFPVFSAKTVKGKPLHTWAVEGRLNEIEIPTQTSTVYRLNLTNIETKMRVRIYEEALAKVNSIPLVTDERKALGNDFRRVDVRADWQQFKNAGAPSDRFTILHFSCIASSGTYMRSLSEAIAKDLGTTGLAYHIHRTHIGVYRPIIGPVGLWQKRY